MRIVILALATALLVTGCKKSGDAEAAVEAAEVEAPTMNVVLRRVGKNRLTDHDRAVLEAAVASGEADVATLAVAVLYGHDPATWADALYDHYAVHDYTVREREGLQVVDPAEVQAELASLRTAAGVSKDSLVGSLVAFLAFRDRNAWLVMPGEQLSVARTMRSLLLTAVWEEAESHGRLDALQVLETLDAKARQAALGDVVRP